MSNKPKRKTATPTRPRARTSQAQPTRRVDIKKWAIWGGSAVLLGLLILFIVTDQPEQVDLPDVTDPPAGAEAIEIPTANHLNTAIAYAQDPPAGGDHNPNWLECGFYESPVPNENAVHSLEHGVVWITFQPGLPESDINSLRPLGNEAEIIVSPYPGLDSPVVASAWGWQQRFDSADDPELLEFISALRDAPTSPEPFASCAGGVGDPA